MQTKQFECLRLTKQTWVHVQEETRDEIFSPGYIQSVGFLVLLPVFFFSSLFHLFISSVFRTTVIYAPEPISALREVAPAVAER